MYMYVYCIPYLYSVVIVGLFFRILLVFTRKKETMEVFCGKTINQYKSVFVIQQKQTLPFIFYYLVNKP